MPSGNKSWIPPWSTQRLVFPLLTYYTFVNTQKTSVDICTNGIGARATCDTSPDDDPTHRGGHGRDTETQLPTIGNLRFWSPATDVAALSESHVRANRGAQKDRRRRWRRLFPPG